MPNAMLSIRSLEVAYGGLVALRDVSLEVASGQLVTAVGANGAGKTTLFKTISGTVAPRAGAITYEGRDLLAVPPAERAHLGIAHVPEGRQVFASMTVMENLEMGAYTRNGRARRAELLPTILDLFPGARRASQPAGRHALRRRAADAGDRPRARLRTEAADAGRALHGPRADHRGRHLRAHQAGAREHGLTCFWSSSGRSRRSRPATAATCWRPGGWCSKARVIR